MSGSSVRDNLYVCMCHYCSYVQYSGVAAKAVRACIKSKDGQEAAAKRGNKHITDLSFHTLYL